MTRFDFWHLAKVGVKMFTPWVHSKGMLIYFCNNLTLVNIKHISNHLRWWDDQYLTFLCPGTVKYCLQTSTYPVASVCDDSTYPQMIWHLPRSSSGFISLISGKQDWVPLQYHADYLAHLWHHLLTKWQIITTPNKPTIRPNPFGLKMAVGHLGRGKCYGVSACRPSEYGVFIYSKGLHFMKNVF